MFSRENLMGALKRVEQNKGAPGVDGMTTAELRPWLQRSWPGIRVTLDEGTYRPRPVRRVKIPKPDGGERELGVPTVLDRLTSRPSRRRWCRFSIRTSRSTATGIDPDVAHNRR